MDKNWGRLMFDEMCISQLFSVKLILFIFCPVILLIG